MCRSSLLSVQDGVRVHVVVHLHLLVNAHVLAPGLDVVKQLVDGRREVGTLLQEHVELPVACLAMLGRGIGSSGLLLHVIDFQCQDAQAVHGPCGALGIDGGAGQGEDVMVACVEIAVDGLHQVGAFLIAAVAEYIKSVSSNL